MSGLSQLYPTYTPHKKARQHTKRSFWIHVISEIKLQKPICTLYSKKLAFSKRTLYSGWPAFLRQVKTETLSMENFALICCFDFISNLECYFFLVTISGILDVKSTIRFQSWPNGYPQPLWFCFSGYVSTELSCRYKRGGAYNTGEQGHLFLLCAIPLIVTNENKFRIDYKIRGAF